MKRRMKEDERERDRRGEKEEREGRRTKCYVGAAVLESVPDREEKKESGSV